MTKSFHPSLSYANHTKDHQSQNNRSMGFGNNKVVLLLRLLLVIICALAATSKGVEAQPLPVFKCFTEGLKCRAVVDYLSPNTTTLSDIQKLFNVNNLLDIVGANGLPGTTLSNHRVKAKQIVKIPFQCMCSNGEGLSNKLPVYTIIKDDTLSHIATDVYSGLVSYQKIEQVNSISDPTLIQPGQKVWIPLPCSCDEVNGSSVVHYGHLVASGSSVEQIAQQYGTTQNTLLTLNNMTDPKALQAGQILDVPLKACSSSVVQSDSLDSPLVVANGTNVYTANGCVKCNCDSANNFTLHCEPSQLKPTEWPTCPSMQCGKSTNVLIGNITSVTSCNRTSCAYAGYNKQTILTTLATQSTCPAASPGVPVLTAPAASPGVPVLTTPGASGASRSSLQGWGWNNLFIFILFCVYLML